ncbi:MAG: hypothetical protein OEV94_01790 [Deltaproteobacteria bacterium]|nr:hypothetical protein [Deltaproteobacteria bacterium]
MDTQGIEIVISGKDQFSPVFLKLESALAGVSQNAATARGETESFGQSFSRQVGQISEIQLASREELTAGLLDMEQRFGESMVALDSATAQRRAEARRQAQAQESAEAETFQASRLAQMEAFSLAQEAQQRVSLNQRLEVFRDFYGGLAALAATQGKSMAQAAKALAIAEAMISTYLAANRTLASNLPFPLNVVAMAGVVARGLANVAHIQQVNIAHGGLEQVPEDSTFLLKRGERVLSPTQNRDLTRFLSEDKSSSGLVIQNLAIHMFENATHADALLAMAPEDMARLTRDKILPALDRLARQGIKPAYSSDLP